MENSDNKQNKIDVEGDLIKLAEKEKQKGDVAFKKKVSFVISLLIFRILNWPQHITKDLLLSITETQKYIAIEHRFIGD